MKRFALIELRLATADDFRTLITPGNYLPKWNVPYLEEGFSGKISKTVFYLTEQTDKAQFSQLFKTNKIWVFAKPNEVESTFNCIDWELVDRELDYEIEQSEKLIQKLKINEKEKVN